MTFCDPQRVCCDIPRLGVVSKLFSNISQITDFCDRGEP
jgi:hypothetical protein